MAGERPLHFYRIFGGSVASSSVMSRIDQQHAEETYAFFLYAMGIHMCFSICIYSNLITVMLFPISMSLYAIYMNICEELSTLLRH